MADAHHITELEAVDIALSSVIAGAYDGLADSGPEAYRRFLKRPTKEKFFRGNYADPADLLRKVASAMKGRGADMGKPVKGEPDLPLIAYNRAPGLMGADDRSIIRKILWNDEQTKAYDLTIINLSLTYKVTFLAWDAPTLDKISVAWFAYIARKTRANRRFVVPVRIGADILQIPANINDPRSIMTSDVSINFHDGGRIFGAETDVQVNTAVVTGVDVTPMTELQIMGIARDYVTGGYTARHKND